MADHAQVQVPGCGFTADAGIVNLLSYLNRDGELASGSCEGGPSRAATDAGAQAGDETFETADMSGYVSCRGAESVPRLLYAMGTLIAASGDAELDEAFRSCSHGSLWEISLARPAYWAALAVANAEAAAGRTLDEGHRLRAEIDDAWSVFLTAPARHLWILDQTAKTILR